MECLLELDTVLPVVRSECADSHKKSCYAKDLVIGYKFYWDSRDDTTIYNWAAKWPHFAQPKIFH